MTGAIENVENETDKVLHKFRELSRHGDQTLGDLIQLIESHQRDLSILTCKFKLENCNCNILCFCFVL